MLLQMLILRKTFNIYCTVYYITQPVEWIVEEWEEILVVEDEVIKIIKLCSDYF